MSSETNDLGDVTTVAILTTNLDKVSVGNGYIVDAIGIANNSEKTIYGISFVTLKNIDTPVYFATVSHVIDSDAKKLVEKN